MVGSRNQQPEYDQPPKNKWSEGKARLKVPRLQAGQHQTGRETGLHLLLHLARTTPDHTRLHPQYKVGGGRGVVPPSRPAWGGQPVGGKNTGAKQRNCCSGGFKIFHQPVGPWPLTLLAVGVNLSPRVDPLVCSSHPPFFRAFMRWLFLPDMKLALGVLGATLPAGD